MKCGSCGSGMDKGWRFCPKCGTVGSGDMFDFGPLFSRVFKEMEEMMLGFGDKESDFEAVDISPSFRDSKTKKSGFTVRIHSGAGMKPNVEVKTFGDVDKDIVREQVKKLGYDIPFGSGDSPVPKAGRKGPAPKTTEEPATDVRRLDGRVVVDMDVPGVRKEDDIEIAELESSVEVKAFAGDKAYFKILTIPEQFSLKERRFSRGRLHLEFA